MNKKVLINIKGVQHYDEDNDVVELLTVGRFYRRDGNYYISYDESEATGFEGSRTTLKVEDGHRVTMRRKGASSSQLIIEKNKRHQCQYNAGYGSMIMGVSCNRIVSTLTDDGGDLIFAYTLDFNASMASMNEVFIHVNASNPASQDAAPAKSPATEQPAAVE